MPFFLPSDLTFVSSTGILPTKLLLLRSSSVTIEPPAIMIQLLTPSHSHTSLSDSHPSCFVQPCPAVLNVQVLLCIVRNNELKIVRNIQTYQEDSPKVKGSKAISLEEKNIRRETASARRYKPTVCLVLW